jgi:hypothetical protein
MSQGTDWLGCAPHVSVKFPALQFGTSDFDNIKGPYYSLLAKEVAKFHLRTDKQFMDSESCCVVDLEL